MGAIFDSPEVYMCESIIESVGDFKTVTQIIGNHQPGRNDFDVKAFSVVNQYLLEFPLNVSNFFPKLESIRVFQSKLKRISRSDLESFTDLKELDLTYNDIEIINSDLFQSNLKMEAIAFNLNPLKHVAHHVFDHLPNLSTLDFRFTRCVNATATANSPMTTFEVIFEIFRQCPPTTEMLLKEIMDSEGIQEILGRLEILENNNNNVTRTI